MPLYECVFIARNDVTQQQVETIAEEFTEASRAAVAEAVKKLQAFRSSLASRT